jgi:hypothetical protein
MKEGAGISRRGGLVVPLERREMSEKPLESDGKTYSKRVTEWRERYLESANQEIVGILTDESRSPTQRFWDAKGRMKKEAKLLVDLLDGHSRSKMERYLILMYGYNFIGDAELAEFSEELRERIQRSSRALSE